MNVFILSTGRCGSTTFDRACRHITNYTTAHESRAGCVGKGRLKYPSNHIESDNRLSWFLGRLDDQYGDEAFYVHLTRSADKVAASYVGRQAPGQMLFAYANGIYLHMPYESKLKIEELAWDYIETVNKNIAVFLRNKRNKIDIEISNPKENFTNFWNMIGATGNLEEALGEFDTKYNRSVRYVTRIRKYLKGIYSRRSDLRPGSFVLKLAVIKVYRAIRYFPEYILTI